MSLIFPRLSIYLDFLWLFLFVRLLVINFIQRLTQFVQSCFECDWSSSGYDGSFFDDVHLIAIMQKTNEVGGQNHCLSPTQRLDTLLKDDSCHFRVHCRKGIIQQIDVCIGVEGAGQSQPGSLASRESHSPLANHCLVPLRQQLQIISEAGHCESLLIFLGFEGTSEEKVTFNRVREDHRFLLDESNAALNV
jgi:hypothetical protein